MAKKENLKNQYYYEWYVDNHDVPYRMDQGGYSALCDKIENKIGISDNVIANICEDLSFEEKDWEDHVEEIADEIIDNGNFFGASGDFECVVDASDISEAVNLFYKVKAGEVEVRCIVESEDWYDDRMDVLYYFPYSEYADISLDSDDLEEGFDYDSEDGKQYLLTDNEGHKFDERHYDCFGYCLDYNGELKSLD